MSVRDEVVRLIVEEGLSPPQIARRRGVGVATILHYVDEMVGRGRLRRSDVLFSVPSEQRRAIAEELGRGRSTKRSAVMSRLRRRGITVDEEQLEVVLRYGDARHALGELYEDIRSIELYLHQFIREVLEGEFGPGETGWWRKGVPRAIRIKCHTRREEDEEVDTPPDPYCYTDLLDLRTILDQRWSLLSKHLAPKTRSQKKRFLAGLLRLNQIRRLVMHPVRGGRPTEDDFEFIRDVRERLSLHKAGITRPPSDVQQDDSQLSNASRE